MPNEVSNLPLHPVGIDWSHKYCLSCGGKVTEATRGSCRTPAVHDAEKTRLAKLAAVRAERAILCRRLVSTQNEMLKLLAAAPERKI